jgi:hypothetical protein
VLEETLVEEGVTLESRDGKRADEEAAEDWARQDADLEEFPLGVEEDVDMEHLG